jgi:UDP-N-acetylmuramate--alanine ligase
LTGKDQSPDFAHLSAADRQAIVEGLQTFPGIHRRFERLGNWNDVELIDDYGHHPTAITVTIACVRERYPGRKLWCVFQPHQLSRTAVLMEGFATALALADRVVVAPVFSVRESSCGEERAELSRQLAEQVVARGTPCGFAPSLDHLLRTLDDSLQPGDVLLTMGAGDIGQIQHEFLRRLS